MDCSLPDYAVHGISQARILEWVAISFSRGSSQLRAETHIACLAVEYFTTEYLGNHDGVVTHLEPNILECEVKRALVSITTNKASGGNGIPTELF